MCLQLELGLGMQGGSKVRSKMLNILVRNLPRVVFHARDSQLHQDYTIDSDKRILLSESISEELGAPEA